MNEWTVSCVPSRAKASEQIGMALENIFGEGFQVRWLIFHTILIHGLWNPEVQYRIHKGCPIIPIQSRINPISRIDTYLFKIHSNIVLPSTTRPPHSIQYSTYIYIYIYIYIVFVLFWWGGHYCPMLCDLFKIYWAPPNWGITRTRICRLNFSQRPIFFRLEVL